MRQWTDIMDLRPSLIGTISTIGGTAIGAPIDRLGFNEVFAFYLAGAVDGTGDASALHNLDFKIQESASPDGTGASWSDITDRGGGVGGSFDFDQLSISTTDPGMYMEKQYCNFNDANRSRYIRFHATLSGTVGLGAKIACGFILGRPIDTLYVTSAETQATGNGEFTQLK